MLPVSQTPTTARAEFAHTVRQARPSWWIVAASGAALALATLVGCSGNVGGDESTRASSDAIIGGALDNDQTASTGVVALRVGYAAPFELCSGTLIAPNVVLTARHCVSKSVAQTVFCDEKGNSLNGDHVGADYEPAAIRVFTGASPALNGTPAATGRAIFHPAGKTLCNSDIALVVLDAAVTEMAPLRIRLKGAALPGEMVRSIGYGKNDRGFAVGTRLRKEGVGVLAVGAAISPSQTALATFEFEVGQSICQGDSGGPAISEVTGAVIGVVSRGGSCDDTSGHVYTQPSGFPTLFEDAFTLAGGAPAAEDAKVQSAPAAAPPAPSKAPAMNGPQGGCAVSATTSASESGGSLLVLFGAALLISRRRR